MEAVKERVAALVKQNEQAALAASGGWSREQIEAVKRQICPKGISDDELALFVNQCQRSGLDPFLKQAFCVPRRTKVGESWVTKHEFQPAEAGMLARAEDFPDFRGVQSAPVYSKDSCDINEAEGWVKHTHPVQNRGDLIGAWAIGKREGRVPVVKFLPLGSYVQESPLWKRMPATMIAKCAKVAVLRELFPKQFGGLYIQEELPSSAPEPRSVAPPATHYQGHAPALPREEQSPPEEGEIVEPDHDSVTGEVKDAAAELTEAEQITGWLDLIGKADSVKALFEIGKELAKQFPKDSPVRVATNEAYNARQSELRRG